MAKTVDEIMNREFFGVRPGDSADEALQHILALGITGAPVVDPQGRPVGMASFRDLLSRTDGANVCDRMTSPAVAVRETATIEEVARYVADSGHHRVIVVDADGCAVGVVSTLDVIRGLIGMPAKHPGSFPHYDHETGLVWTDDEMLDLDHLEVAPDGPGIFVLSRGRAGTRDVAIWAEDSENVRTRLTEILSTTTPEPAALAQALAHGSVRFRAAPVSDAATRQWLVKYVRAQVLLRLAPVRVNPGAISESD